MQTIGILGGMGPDATNQLCHLITQATPASCDEEHIPVITFSNPHIPSRLKALMEGGPSPVPELVRSARVLEAAGANFLIMPCNVAHYYIDEVQSFVAVPILNMVSQTVEHIAEKYPDTTSIGILASTPTVRLGLYAKPLKESGRVLIAPNEHLQESFVMEAIYGAQGVKAGYVDKPRQMLMAAVSRLIAGGAQVILSACTEVSVALAATDGTVPIVDPLKVIAQVAVDRAMCAEPVPNTSVAFRLRAMNRGRSA